MKKNKYSDRPFSTAVFVATFWQMVEEMGEDYYESDMFTVPYRSMLSIRGKKYGQIRTKKITPEERRRFAYSGVYFNIMETKGKDAAMEKIIKEFGEETGNKLINLWDSTFRKKNTGKALEQMKNT